MTTPTDRPTGVIALAAVAAIAGVADILAGLGDIGIAGGFLSDHGFGDTLDGIMTGVGVVLLAVGILGLATGYGLWVGRNWAWLITRLWASLCVIAGVVGGGLALLGDTLTSQIVGAIIGSTGTAVVAAVVLWVSLSAAREGGVRTHVIPHERERTSATGRRSADVIAQVTARRWSSRQPGPSPRRRPDARRRALAGDACVLERARRARQDG